MDQNPYESPQSTAPDPTAKDEVATTKYELAMELLIALIVIIIIVCIIPAGLVWFFWLARR